MLKRGWRQICSRSSPQIGAAIVPARCGSEFIRASLGQVFWAATVSCWSRPVRAGQRCCANEDRLRPRRRRTRRAAESVQARQRHALLAKKFRWVALLDGKTSVGKSVRRTGIPVKMSAIRRAQLAAGEIFSCKRTSAATLACAGNRASVRRWLTKFPATSAVVSHRYCGLQLVPEPRFAHAIVNVVSLTSVSMRAGLLRRCRCSRHRSRRARQACRPRAEPIGFWRKSPLSSWIRPALTEGKPMRKSFRQRRG